MCGCEPGYTCTRCKGTPLDPFYEDDEPREPRDPEPGGQERDDVYALMREAWD